jgi:hypothetical protein
VSALCLGTVHGLLWTLVVNGALLYCGHVAARRFWPAERASVRLAANGTISIALALAIFYPLAAAGMFTRSAVLMAAVVVAVLFHLAWGRCRGVCQGTVCSAAFRPYLGLGGYGLKPALQTQAVPGELRAFVGWCRAVSRSRGALLLAGAGLLVVAAAYRAALWPPLSWDSLMYHDYFAGTWVQSGRLVGFSMPRALEVAPYMPTHFEALVAWVMLPFHGDFLVNFANFPVLALAAVSLYALGRDLELDVADASLAAGLLCVSPTMLAYVCTQYSDLLVAATLLCAALFMLRYLRGRAWADAVMAFLACALAVGTKYSAIPPAGMLCLVVVVAAARRPGGRFPGAAWTLALGIAILALFGGYRYARNWLEVGNPLYPATIRLLGHDIFPGSSAVEDLAARLGRGSWLHDLKQVGHSMTYAYGAQPTPLTWGPKLALVLFLGFLAPLLAPRGRRRVELWCLWLCWVAPFVLSYLDHSTAALVARRHWPVVFCRFLAAPVGLATVCAVAAIALLPSEWSRRVLRAGLCAFLLYDMFAMCILPDTPFALIAVACVAAVLAGVVALVPSLKVRRPHWAVAATVCLAALLAGACALQWVRDHWRNRFYETRMELHPVDKHWVAGWAFCDDPRESKTIAFTSYEPSFGHHWFFYPLMGRRLQNRVVYVPTDRPVGGQGSLAGPDEACWLDNLRRVAATHVFVQLNPTVATADPAREPVEMRWIKGRPELFEGISSGDHYRVYKVRRPDGRSP